MANIEDQPVFGSVEHRVDRNRQLYDTQPCTEMAARHRYRVDGFSPEFVCQLAQLPVAQPLHVAGFGHLIEKRRG
ncbi:hypothetical protein GCM10007908_01770 [Rhizobium albus]|nr:hypothetical protein GCM10007908_01770 [Rhizobium albus]